jgi:protein TonB
VKGLRPLLRLDDKVAAEGRRLQNLGAGTSRWGGLTLLVAAAMLHVAMMMLPALHVKATLPAASPAPDFPRVWRFMPPSPPAPVPPPSAPPATPPAARASGVAAVPAAAARPLQKQAARRPLSTEPVPEPAPDVTMRMITSEVEENIPYPDAPPPPIEPGSPFASAPQREDAGAPELISRSQPVYPVAARAVGVEGQVRLRLSVLSDGRVDRAAVVDCSRPGVGFEAAAVEAVKRWRYAPASPSTAPRTVIVTMQFRKQDARP